MIGAAAWGRARSGRWIPSALAALGIVGLLAAHDARIERRVSAQGGRPHCGLLTSNETWNEGDSPHLVTCNVVVRHSRLTIGPGATVLMGEGASLVIQSGSELVAEGIAEAQIRFEPIARDELPGSWGQLRLEAGARPSRADYVSFIGGGAGQQAMVEVHGDALTVNHSRFQKALAAPLAFAANAVGPSLGVAGPGPAKRACELVQFVNNGQQTIRVLTDAALDITDAQTWYNFCVPYRVDGELTVAGADSPTLSLEQGVEFRFGPGAGLTAGYSLTATGQLETNGSPELPVVLTGAVEAPGYWRGATISRYGGSSSSLFGLRLAYGGGPAAGDRAPNPAAMLTVMRPDTLAGGGLVFQHAAGYPLAAHAGAIGGLAGGLVGVPDGNFRSNGVQRVLVLADLDNPDVARTAEWPGLGIPYEIQGDLLIARPQPPAVLTLGEGAELIFDGSETLTAGDGMLGQGGFRAQGSREAPVVLRGETPDPGSWGGLRLKEATAAELINTHVEGGGADDQPMVVWGNAKGGQVVFTEFSHAKHYPVQVPLNGAETILNAYGPDDVPANFYTGNGIQRVLVDPAGELDHSTTWGDPGIPVELASGLRLSRAGSTSLALSPGLDLRFPAKAALVVGVDEARQGVLLVPGEDRYGRQDPVTLSPVDAVAGWAGVSVGPGSRIEANRLAISETAPRAAALSISGAVTLGLGTRIDAAQDAVGIDVRGEGASLFGQHLLIQPARIGVRVGAGAVVSISQSVLAGSEAGFLNEDAARCQRATLNYWGDPSGPPTDAAPEPCADGHANPAGKGARVSRGVNWWPFALDSTGFTPNTAATATPMPSPTPGERMWRIYLPLAER